MLVAAVLARRHLEPAGLRYLGAEPDGQDTVGQVRATLGYGMLVTAATILGTAALAVLVRRPLVWVRWAAWCVLAALGVLLFLGLVAGADPAGSTPDSDATELDRLFYDL